jgi:hypothetical protein
LPRKPISEPAARAEASPLGYPHGAFTRDGRWVPGGAYDMLTKLVCRDLMWVRRHNVLSPAGYLLRMRAYKHSQEAARLIGSPTLGQMSHREAIDDWGAITEVGMTDYGCWLVHCGSPYRDHRWHPTSGHWVPMDGRPVWG